MICPVKKKEEVVITQYEGSLSAKIPGRYVFMEDGVNKRYLGFIPEDSKYEGCFDSNGLLINSSNPIDGLVARIFETEENPKHSRLAEQKIAGKKPKSRETYHISV